MKMKGLVASFDRNQAFLVEALRFSLGSVELAFNRVVTASKLLETETDYVDLVAVFSAMADCWMVVDNADRAREVFSHIRGPRRKLDWVQSFLNGTDSVRSFRNVLQHVATHIPRLSNDPSPIVGSLAWIDSKDTRKSYSVWMSGTSKSHSVTTLPLDTWLNRFSGDFLFSIDNREIDLSSIARCCRDFSLALEFYLQESSSLSDVDVAASKFIFKI